MNCDQMSHDSCAGPGDLTRDALLDGKLRLVQHYGA